MYQFKQFEAQKNLIGRWKILQEDDQSIVWGAIDEEGTHHKLKYTKEPTQLEWCIQSDDYNYEKWKVLSTKRSEIRKLLNSEFGIYLTSQRLESPPLFKKKKPKLNPKQKQYQGYLDRYNRVVTGGY